MICSTRQYQQQTSPSGGLKAVFQKDTLWETGSTLKVEFIDAPVWKKKWVEKVITEQIAPYVNLTFEWDTSQGDISIAFPDEIIAQSMLGRMSRTEYPSMLLGWLDPPLHSFEWDGQVYQVPPNQIRNESENGPIVTGATVVHEFGHALGMIHEHQNPFGEPIQWNEAAVIAYYSGPPNHWNTAEIRYNILDNVPTDTHNGSAFDKDSIMIYSVPGAFTYNLPEGISLPSQLSSTDKLWLSKMYPFDGYSCYDGKCSAGNDFQTLEECEAQCSNTYLALKDCNDTIRCFYQGDTTMEIVDDTLCDGIEFIDACGNASVDWGDCSKGVQTTRETCLYNGYQMPTSMCRNGGFVIQAGCDPNTPANVIGVKLRAKMRLQKEIRDLLLQRKKARDNGNETMLKVLTEKIHDKRGTTKRYKSEIAKSKGSSRLSIAILAIAALVVIYVTMRFIIFDKSKRPLSSRISAQ